MPPSDSATCRSGKRSGTPDHSHSPAARSAFTGNTVGNSSNGGSGEGSGAHDDAPVCRHTTVAVSSQAAKKGSHVAAEDGGQLQLGRELGEADRLEAAGRVGPHLGRRHLHVGQPGQLQGDDAVRVGPRPHLEVPVVEGAQAGQSEVLVRRPRVDRAAEARDERGEAQRGPDAGAVHVEHAGVDVEAARPHFVEAGRLHAPFRAWPPHHRVEPDVGIVLPLEDPALRPVLLLDDAGRRRGEGGGEAMFEQVRRLNEVVVDRNHRHPDGPGLRVGEQGGPARCGPCVDGSHEKVTLSSATLSRPGGCA